MEKIINNMEKKEQEIKNDKPEEKVAEMKEDDKVEDNKEPEKKETKTQQYYVLPENQTQQSAQPTPQTANWGFGLSPVYDPKAAKQAEKNYNNKHFASGIVSWIVVLVAAATGIFGAYLKNTLMTDTATTIVMNLFGFGIIVYGMLLIAAIMHIISFVLAFVQIGKNRRVFSIVTCIIVPLLNLVALGAEVFLFIYGF